MNKPQILFVEDDAAVGTAVHCLTDDFGGTGQTHGQQCNRRTGIGVFDAECLFEGVQILRVEHGRKGCTVHGTLWSHCVRSDIACVG